MGTQIIGEFLCHVDDHGSEATGDPKVLGERLPILAVLRWTPPRAVLHAALSKISLIARVQIS